jgi:nucleotide-binding universal stress UspA family protein
MFNRILVATDGSVHSRRAALIGAELARTLGASLTLLTAYQLPPGFEGEPSYSRDLEAALGEAQAVLAAEAAAIAANGGPAAELEAIGGAEPGQTLFDATASGRFDLLVMGTRGLGRFGRTFLGSLSAHVAAHGLASVAVPIETEYHPLP